MGSSSGMVNVSNWNVVEGDGWFSFSLKCFTQRVFCSSVVYSRTFPFLSSIGTFELLFVHVNSLTKWNKVLASFRFAASSASVPLWFNHALLLALQLLFTSLFNSLYFAAVWCFTPWVLACSRCCFATIRWSINAHVLYCIHRSLYVPCLRLRVSCALSVIASLNNVHCSSTSVACCNSWKWLLSCVWYSVTRVSLFIFLTSYGCSGLCWHFLQFEFQRLARGIGLSRCQHLDFLTRADND